MSNLRPRQKQAPRDMDLSGMTDLRLAEHVAVLSEAVTLADRKALSAMRRHRDALRAYDIAEAELQRRDRQARGANTTAVSSKCDTSSVPMLPTRRELSPDERMRALEPSDLPAPELRYRYDPRGPHPFDVAMQKYSPAERAEIIGMLDQQRAEMTEMLNRSLDAVAAPAHPLR